MPHSPEEVEPALPESLHTDRRTKGIAPHRQTYCRKSSTPTNVLPGRQTYRRNRSTPTDVMPEMLHTDKRTAGPTDALLESLQTETRTAGNSPHQQATAGNAPHRQAYFQTERRNAGIATNRLTHCRNRCTSTNALPESLHSVKRTAGIAPQRQTYCRTDKRTAGNAPPPTNVLPETLHTDKRTAGNATHRQTPYSDKHFMAPLPLLLSVSSTPSASCRLSPSPLSRP